MVTFPVARRTAGVLAAFFVKVTVTPLGILMVVKLKTPLGGRVSTVLLLGLKAPSAPVLPLMKVWAVSGVAVTAKATRLPSTRPTASHLRLFMDDPPC
jgi:hypothetical protein